MVNCNSLALIFIRWTIMLMDRISIKPVTSYLNTNWTVVAYKGVMEIFNSEKKILIVLLSLFLLTVIGTRVAAQQQPFNYTQYMDNLTPFNPAYSLLDKSASINTLASKQLVGINGGPTTFLLNGGLPIESINSSAGLILLSDQLAIEQETEVNAYFAKAIQLGEDAYLAVSLNAGLRNYIANYTSIDPTDPEFRNDVRETKPNVGFGVMYYTDWYYLGISVPELTITSLGTASVQNNSNFTNHYYFTGALITNIAEDIKFKPATLLFYTTGLPALANISGTFYLKDILGLGVNYSTDKEMAGILTVNFNGYHIGYSYKFGVGSENLGGVNDATHEVTLSYRFGKRAAIPKVL
jgi:type IX secretion system PorP/SprF family membrane protein